MKKIIRCCLFLLITIALFGCVTTEKKVSKISYYVEGSVNITLSPNTYEEGKGLVLPIPNLKSYEIFDGWYEDRTYKGVIALYRHLWTEVMYHSSSACGSKVPDVFLLLPVLTGVARLPCLHGYPCWTAPERYPGPDNIPRYPHSGTSHRSPGHDHREAYRSLGSRRSA